MPLSDNLGFVHRFVPPLDDRLRPVTLLLLGTGGDDNDLLPVGRELWPAAALLARTLLVDRETLYPVAFVAVVLRP